MPFNFPLRKCFEIDLFIIIIVNVVVILDNDTTRLIHLQILEQMVSKYQYLPYCNIISRNISILLENTTTTTNDHIIYICDEDEEMIPVIDIESEESAKNQIQIRSE
jgi:hypothetical protein